MPNSPPLVLPELLHQRTRVLIQLYPVELFQVCFHEKCVLRKLLTFSFVLFTDASHSLISAEGKDTFDIIEVTPVNTIERNSGQLRRSMSKASSTSSSSGCLSDRCSSGGSQQPNHPMGFESDFPMGGTIKKRPSVISNPKVHRKTISSANAI